MLFGRTFPTGLFSLGSPNATCTTSHSQPGLPTKPFQTWDPPSIQCACSCARACAEVFCNCIDLFHADLQVAQAYDGFMVGLDELLKQDVIANAKAAESQRAEQALAEAIAADIGEDVHVLITTSSRHATPFNCLQPLLWTLPCLKLATAGASHTLVCSFMHVCRANLTCGCPQVQVGMPDKQHTQSTVRAMQQSTPAGLASACSMFLTCCRKRCVLCSKQLYPAASRSQMDSIAHLGLATMSL